MFKFINGQTYKSKIISSQKREVFEIEYFHSRAGFKLIKNHKSGTDLTLMKMCVTELEFCEVKAGWVSVFLALKCAVDYNIDIRNHDRMKSWDQMYPDN